MRVYKLVGRGASLYLCLRVAGQSLCMMAVARMFGRIYERRDRCPSFVAVSHSETASEFGQTLILFLSKDISKKQSSTQRLRAEATYEATS
jgi:hypothetical protein